MRRPASPPIVAVGVIAVIAIGGCDRSADRDAGGVPYGAAGTVSDDARAAEQRTVPRYDVEYPAVGYATRLLEDAIARLEQRIEAGEVRLEVDATRGYLDSLLAALGIGAESQTLVFSKTSLQVQSIRAASPRAIYFNDDVYVAWVPGAPTLEIASMDPNLGPVFYTLAQDTGPPRFERQLGQCLRCHDSYSLTGGGVPRFITGSGYTDTEGNLVAHEGWILTSDRTPLRSRWGGWYVSGFHGDQVHLGNIAVRAAAELQNLEALRTGNLESLDSLLDTGPYLTNRSDIVALLVLEHQVRVQNAITRVHYDTISAAADGDIAAIAEPLVEALLMAGQVQFTDAISGTAGFNRAFEARGPRDSQGRSLRDLDLEMRLFEYPLSFQIYSAAFDALPARAKTYVYGRLAEILGGADRSSAFAHLSSADRAAILEILRETKPDFAVVEAGGPPRRKYC
jgi:hypothetical protein